MRNGVIERRERHSHETQRRKEKNEAVGTQRRKEKNESSFFFFFQVNL